MNFKPDLQIMGASAGLIATVLFCIAFCLFAYFREFSLLDDYISELGAGNHYGALAWNLIGFASVGILYSVFGWTIGLTVNDRFAGTCFVCCGLGFAFAAIPAEMIEENSPLTKAHVVSVCMSLAGWCFGLARLGSRHNKDNWTKTSANLAGVLSVIPMAGMGLGWIPAPISHRLILLIVFGWTLMYCVRVLKSKFSDGVLPQTEKDAV